MLFVPKEKGQGTSEIVILFALIIVVCIVMISFVGPAVEDLLIRWFE